SSMLAIRTERGRDLGMGTVTGAHTSSLGVGQMLGPILFGIIVDLFSLRAAFYVGGAVGLIGVLAAFKFLQQRTQQVVKMNHISPQQSD
ncbi:MAG: MFS transporter, partial [Chloroflexota bacterium]